MSESAFMRVSSKTPVFAMVVVPRTVFGGCEFDELLLLFDGPGVGVAFGPGVGVAVTLGVGVLVGVAVGVGVPPIANSHSPSPSQSTLKHVLP